MSFTKFLESHKDKMRRPFGLGVWCKQNFKMPVHHQRTSQSLSFSGRVRPQHRARSYSVSARLTLTLVSHSLARNWVPVQTRWLLPSNQKHQKQDLCPAHGPHVSSRWLEVALSDGAINQMISGTCSEKAARLLAACREWKKTQHISSEQHFTSFIGLLVYLKLCCQRVYDGHIFQRVLQSTARNPAAMKDKFSTFRTCSIKLNMVIKIHRNVIYKNELCKL